MFLGHFALAMGTKRVAPKPAVGTYVLAAQFADGIWPVFVLLGIEEVRIAPGITAATPLDFLWYPYSHSLLFDVLWATLFAGVYYALRRDRLGALWLAALVVLFMASAGGPPPPSVRALAWVGIAGWLLVAWGYWIERHRKTAR